MGDKSKIEWTDATWNPVTGCTKVSQGCKFCYAERVFSRPYPGRAFTDVRCHPERLDQPLRWKKPRRIFVNSMSDLFHEAVPRQFLIDVLATMTACPQHTFQTLTKRPHRMKEMLDEITSISLRGHMWWGVSVEDQKTADERIPLLLQTPAAVRFVSYEPALGPVKLHDTWLPAHVWPPIFSKRNSGFHDDQGGGIHWLIAGGESGPHARPSHPDWFRSVRDQCQAAGVPFFFKQWGEWANESHPFFDRFRSQQPNIPSRVQDDGHWCGHGAFGHEYGACPMVLKVGKKAAGRLLDGREWNEFPYTTGNEQG